MSDATSCRRCWEAGSLDALNARFPEDCAKRRQARPRGHAATIA
ncbi:MAG: hypothetical protein ACREDM_00385 [Methylocella sp.]